MNRQCLEHLLTDQERAFFNSTGYLIVEDALDRREIDRLLDVVDRIDARERTAENRGKLMSVTDIVAEDPALVGLIDWPRTLPKVWGILGWNIYLYHSHLDVTPPADAAALSWRVA